MKSKSLTGCLIALTFAGTNVAIPSTAQAGGPAPSQPGQCRAHGHSLGEWLLRYWDWALGGGSNGSRGLTFLPLPAGEYVSGSFTLEDPGVLEGTIDVTLKPGQSFVLPIAVWTGEIYEDGHVDEPVPDSSMNRTEFVITIDGKTVASKEAGSSSPNYVPVTDFSAPVLYDQPTGYGSVGVVYVQGFAMVHGPLSPGLHTMTLHSTLFAENYGLAAIYENTWTINVTP